MKSILAEVSKLVSYLTDHIDDDDYEEDDEEDDDDDEEDEEFIKLKDIENVSDERVNLYNIVVNNYKLKAQEEIKKIMDKISKFKED